MLEIEPFAIDVGADQLDDLAQRLARTRFPDSLDTDGWSYGTDTAYLRELVEYWHDGFDWSTATRSTRSDC